MQSAAMSLDELQSSMRPAWLWDGARARIVWSNAQGIAAFGGETLFDLIDQAFDLRNSDIARIAEMCADMDRSVVQQHSFSLPSVAGDLAVDCDCQIHSLPDGRRGLLIVSRIDEPHTAGSTLMTGVLEAMPIAIVVVTAAGQTIFSNQAAAEILLPAQLETLTCLLDSDQVAQELIQHASEAGTITSVRRLLTRHGEREIRITARNFEASADEEASEVLLMLEDVTERRALERSLAGGKDTPAVPPQPAGPAAEAKQEPSSEASAPLPAPTQASLSQIAREIIQSDVAGDHASPTVEKTPAQLPRLPRAIANLLDQSNEPVILHRQDAIYYANPSSLRFLQFENFGDLVANSGLTTALVELSGPDHRIAATDGSGRPLRLLARTSKFPWHDGVMWQSKLQLEDEPTGQEVALQTTEPTQVTPEPLAVPPTHSADLPPEGRIAPTTPAVLSAGSDDPELRAIVDIAADGLVTMNEAGEIVSISAGAEALFGFRLAEVAGKPFAELLSKQSRPILEGYLASLSESGVASIFIDGREVTGIVSQGGEISLFMTISRLQAGTHARFCAVLRDITQWKKTEAELRGAIKDAETASAQKSEFLARISHELRTPLNAILGFSDVMRSERFGEIQNAQYLGYANDIHKSGNHLLSLINDLLDLSKIEAGKVELNFTSVDLNSATTECVRLLQNQATAARVVVRQNIPPELPNVVADLRSIKQIILNVLSNAVKFTDPGGQVIVSAKLNPAGELVYKIKDTGIGMNETELQDALEPFSRIKAAERSERPGTGLGLPLTRALTQANRARFKISSERKKGTLVEITFPTTRVLAD